MTYVFRIDEPNSGHGHVRKRPDGIRARCAGPTVCGVCKLEEEVVTQRHHDNQLVRDWETFMFDQNQRVVGLEMTQWRAFKAAWTAGRFDGFLCCTGQDLR
jgi:hypothetical protein